jgi:hypothetical protein
VSGRVVTNTKAYEESGPPPPLPSPAPPCLFISPRHSLVYSASSVPTHPLHPSIRRSGAYCQLGSKTLKPNPSACQSAWHGNLTVFIVARHVTSTSNSTYTTAHSTPQQNTYHMIPTLTHNHNNTHSHSFNQALECAHTLAPTLVHALEFARTLAHTRAHT